MFYQERPSIFTPSLSAKFKGSAYDILRWNAVSLERGGYFLDRTSAFAQPTDAPGHIFGVYPRLTSLSGLHSGLKN